MHVAAQEEHRPLGAHQGLVVLGIGKSVWIVPCLLGKLVAVVHGRPGDDHQQASASPGNRCAQRSPLLGAQNAGACCPQLPVPAGVQQQTLRPASAVERAMPEQVAGVFILQRSVPGFRQCGVGSILIGTPQLL